MADAAREHWIERYVRESAQAKLSLIDLSSHLADLVAELAAMSKGGGVLYSCGNGGSACDSMHLTEELVARYLRTRPGIRAQHLLDAGTITCWGNDVAFDHIFERQVETMITSRDALVVFSTSGNSKNILLALEAANKAGALTVALLGKGGGKAKAAAKISLVVDSNVTSHIQECHITLVHMICDLLETTLYPDAK